MIVGLGNPGKVYRRTRHNVGFAIVDLLAGELGIDVRKRKFGGRFGEGEFSGRKVMLLKPWEYMNCSGQAVAKAVGFYELVLSEVLVILDDIWLEPGRIRLRASGSAGGHNGLADVIEKLGSSRICRLRVGIGQGEKVEAYDYVLSEPSVEERPLLEQAKERAKEAVLCWVTEGIEAAMNRFNSGTPSGPDPGLAL